MKHTHSFHVLQTDLQSGALYYYCDVTLSQEFWLLGAQLSLKAMLPLVEILATVPDIVMQGPGAIIRNL